MAKSAAAAVTAEQPRQPSGGGKRAGISKSEQLMEAVRRGELTTVRRLVDKSGADVCTVNQYGLSCLQLAIIGGHTKLAEFIIQKGANIHSIDAKGWTALHDAAQMDMKGLVRKLLSKGCSVTSTTDMGELPIDVAGSVGMERVLCGEMMLRGEEKLARDYERYLGLKLVSDRSRVICPMSHRGPLPMCYAGSRGAHLSPPQLQRRHSSPVLALNKASQPQLRRHYHHLTPVGKQETSGHGEEPPSPRNNRPEVEAGTGNGDAALRHTKLQEAVIDIPLNHETTRHPYRTAAQGSCNINTPRPHRSVSIAASISSASGGRRSAAGKSYYHRERAELGSFRSSAALSAALGVSFNSVATNFESDSGNTLDSSAEYTSSPLPSSRGDASTNPDYKPTRHISFCEQSVFEMARTKMSPSPVATVEKERAAGHLCEVERREQREMVDFKGAAGDGVEESDADSTLDDSHHRTVPKEAIANLKRLPRKPSIIFPARRRSSEELTGAGTASEASRRRSVTFQPEVLLQEMVLDGDLKAVKEILDSGALSDINKLSPAGLTALHQSAIDGNLECAKALIASGADVNCVDCELWTPLHAAAMSGKIDVVRYLLSHGADSLLKNESQQTAYDVAKSGPIRKLLLCAMNCKSLDTDEISDGEYSDEEEREYSHMESESDDDGEEPCYFDSPKSSHENSASPSPEFGENSNTVFLNGSKRPPNHHPTTATTENTPSMLNSTTTDLDDNSRGHNHAGEELGGNDMASEDQGISTMDGSSDCSHRSRMLSEDEGTTRDVLDSDLVPGSLDYRFQEAGLYCDMDTLLKLAKHRKEIDINRVNKSSGITALHHAVLEENFAMVQHLVKDFEVDLHIKDRDGWTPLHAASAVGNIRIAQFLLENGAKASILNNQCEFPVDVAEDEAMEKLLKNVMLGPSVGNLLK